MGKVIPAIFVIVGSWSDDNIGNAAPAERKLEWNSVGIRAHIRLYALYRAAPPESKSLFDLGSENEKSLLWDGFLYSLATELHLVHMMICIY